MAVTDLFSLSQALTLLLNPLSQSRLKKREREGFNYFIFFPFWKIVLSLDSNFSLVLLGTLRPNSFLHFCPPKKKQKLEALVILLLHCSTPRLLLSLGCLSVHFTALAVGNNSTTKKILGVAARKTHHCVWQFLLADSLQTSECKTQSVFFLR